MSDIAMVIRLPEETYKEIKKIVRNGNEMCFIQELIANGTPLEDIKAEIQSIRNSWEKDNYHDEADALTLALEIIDKHIGGKETEGVISEKKVRECIAERIKE